MLRMFTSYHLLRKCFTAFKFKNRLSNCFWLNCVFIYTIWAVWVICALMWDTEIMSMFYLINKIIKITIQWILINSIVFIMTRNFFDVFLYLFFYFASIINLICILLINLEFRLIKWHVCLLGLVET